MADEIVNAGQPAPTPSPEPVGSDQGEPTGPVATPEAIPQKYGGKTAEELLHEVQEKDRYIQQLAEQKARAEYEAQYERNIREQFGGAKPTAEPEPELPAVAEEEFVTDPVKATVKVVKSFFEQQKKEKEKQDRVNYIQNARSNYEIGKNAAMKQNARIFQGVEADVSREVFNAFERGAVDADTLKDPGFWEASAGLVRFLKGERNLEKYYDPNPTPMPAGQTATPSPQRPPQAGVTLTPEQEEAARLGGFTREQFTKMLGNQRLDAERRAR